MISSRMLHIDGTGKDILLKLFYNFHRHLTLVIVKENASVLSVMEMCCLSSQGHPDRETSNSYPGETG